MKLKPKKETKKPKDIVSYEDKMRKVALLASSIVGLVASKAKEGITLKQLDHYGAELFLEFDAFPANYEYKPDWAKTPYPAVMCISVNDTIAHGIPTDYKLKEGDLVNIDTGVIFNKVVGDCALTVGVGKLSKENERLLKFANRACYRGIEVIRDGVPVIEIARAVEDYTKIVNLRVNKLFSGHTIGKKMHEGKTIPFFYDRQDPRYLQYFGLSTLTAGDVVCIEPMVTYSKDQHGQVTGDGWTVKTKDGKNSAMFEHMVLVKKDGYEILTDHFIKA